MPVNLLSSTNIKKNHFLPFSIDGLTFLLEYKMYTNCF